MLSLRKQLQSALCCGSFFSAKKAELNLSRNFRVSALCLRSLPPQWLSVFNSYPKWFAYPQYRNPNFYAANQTALYYRPLKNLPLKAYLDAVQPSPALLEKLGPKAHFIKMDYITEDFIVRGRLGQLLKRDEMFARHAKSCLVRLLENGGLENTFFINYTGHQAPVASVFYEHGIDCVWQLEKEHFPSFSGRIVEQLHDWPGRNAFEKIAPIASSFGLILEPNHGFTTIRAASLPSRETLDRIGIKKVVVLTEYPFNENKLTYDYDPLHFKDDPEFSAYLTLLSKHYELQIMGTEPGEAYQRKLKPGQQSSYS